MANNTLDPNSPANLLSRIQFAETGLVPVTSPEDEECAICFDTCVDPVSLPCKHVYCHDCIDSWVKAPQSGPKDYYATCCKCRSVLCERSAPAPTANADIAQDRFAQTLALAPTYENAPPALDDTGSNPYDLAIRFLRTYNGRDSDGVLRFRTTPPARAGTYTITGPGHWPSIELLCTHVKAAAYTIRARQQFSGHAFGHREVEEWDDIISHLDTLLRACHGNKKLLKELSQLTAYLEPAVRRAWTKTHGRHAVLNSFFNQSHGQCLVNLLDYVGFFIWKETRRAVREGRDQPAGQRSNCHPM